MQHPDAIGFGHAVLQHCGVIVALGAAGITTPCDARSISAEHLQFVADAEKRTEARAAARYAPKFFKDDWGTEIPDQQDSALGAIVTLSALCVLSLAIAWLVLR